MRSHLRLSSGCVKSSACEATSSSGTVGFIFLIVVPLHTFLSLLGRALAERFCAFVPEFFVYLFKLCSEKNRFQLLRTTVPPTRRSWFRAHTPMQFNGYNFFFFPPLLPVARVFLRDHNSVLPLFFFKVCIHIVHEEDITGNATRSPQKMRVLLTICWVTIKGF